MDKMGVVTGQGMAQLVGRIAQTIQDLKRTEAEEAARRKPVEFPMEKAIRDRRGMYRRPDY